MFDYDKSSLLYDRFYVFNWNNNTGHAKIVKNPSF